MRRRFLTSHNATRIAFGVIILFVTAQMSWWIYFQAEFVESVNRTKVESLQREALSLTTLLELGAAEQVRGLLEGQPHLRLAASGNSVVLDETAFEEYLAEHRSVVRMFAFEGPFFVLVVMLGLFIIARNLRLERELKRRQSNFLDAIGHEYKTPISTLRLLIETMQLRDLPKAKAHEYLTRMGTEVDRLDRTGQQVLATARLEDEAPASRRAEHDLQALVGAVLERAQPVLEARGAEVELVEARTPLVVNVSPEEVALMLENLLDNAIKYSPEAQKSVVVRLGSEGRWASLGVEDSGSGIPEGERTKVLERFYRVGSELTRSSPGLGLGLYLVRRAVDSLGGRIRLSGGAAGGTLVTVLLPLASADAVASPSAPVGALS